MYLLYLDDSGSATNTSERFFVLGGLAIFERQTHWIEQELTKLAEQLGPNDTQLEFHATDIRNGKRSWRKLPKERRSKVFLELADIITQSHRSTRLFAAVVDKHSLDGQDAVEVAFEHLCRQFDLFLHREYLRDRGNAQRGLLILDNSAHETSLQTLATDFRKFGHSRGILRNLADVPLFVDSRATRLIQLADFVAYSVRRRYEHNELELMRKLLARFDQHSGRPVGLVHHKLPHDSCECPACTKHLIF